MKIHVTMGNMKTGKMFCWSTPPGITCSAAACATCHKQDCYACKAWRMYPSVRKAWTENYLLAKYDLPDLERQLMEYLRKNGRRANYFRIHVSGDFFTVEYFKMWCRVAAAFPGIKFLAFTKYFAHVVPEAVPVNMTVRLSDWPGIDIPAELTALYPVAYVDDGTRPAETFAGAYHCPGDCTRCKHCFAHKGDTVFKKH